MLVTRQLAAHIDLVGGEKTLCK